MDFMAQPQGVRRGAEIETIARDGGRDAATPWHTKQCRSVIGSIELP
jgi:hypothetical protein